MSKYLSYQVYVESLSPTTLPAARAQAADIDRQIDSRYKASEAVDPLSIAWAQQQTSHTSLLLSIDGTDGRTPGRYIDPARCTACMRAVSVIILQITAKR